MVMNFNGIRNVTALHLSVGFFIFGIVSRIEKEWKIILSDFFVTSVTCYF